MGWALCCELCRSRNVVLEEFEWNKDIASFIPRSTIVWVLAVRCKNCRHVRLAELVRTRFDPDELVPN